MDTVCRIVSEDYFVRSTAHSGLARLKPGVTPDQATAEAAARLAAAFPKHARADRPFGEGMTRGFVLTPMLDWMIKDVKPALWILSAAVALLFAAALLRVLPALMPEDFPRLDDITIDGRVLAVATGLTVASRGRRHPVAGRRVPVKTAGRSPTT